MARPRKTQPAAPPQDSALGSDRRAAGRWGRNLGRSRRGSRCRSRQRQRSCRTLRPTMIAAGALGQQHPAPVDHLVGEDLGKAADQAAAHRAGGGRQLRQEGIRLVVGPEFAKGVDSHGISSLVPSGFSAEDQARGPAGSAGVRGDPAFSARPRAGGWPLARFTRPGGCDGSGHTVSVFLRLPRRLRRPWRAALRYTRSP